MFYIGIDPGKNGALAVLRGMTVFELIPFDENNYKKIMKFLKDSDCGACLEHVGAMPGQGVVSMFHFGENFGYIRGLLEAYSIPYELVRPQKWKKFFSISGKNESINVCKRLYPDANLKKTPQCRKDHDGMAEALLMAEYARRKL